MERIYLDNNATTAVAPEVRDVMIEYLSNKYGNPSSLHSFGEEVLPAIRDAYDEFYKLIDADDEDDILINSCASEGNNTVLKSIMKGCTQKSCEKSHLITTVVEHPSVYSVAEYLETSGVSVTYLPVDSEGLITAQQVIDAITPDTKLVSIMWANNETGVVFPIEEIAKAVHDKGILFHTDATQVIGKLEVSVKSGHFDYLTFSGHKFHAPKGIGALYVKKGAPLIPLIHGGEQMNGLRAGTHNVQGLIGMGMAAKLALKTIKEGVDDIKGLRDKLEKFILNEIPGTFLNGAKDKRMPNTCNVSFAGIEGEALLKYLDDAGIAAATGSACASESLEPSRIVKALNIKANLAHTAIRFSLSKYNNEKEIDYVIKVLPEIVGRLRKISGYTN